MVAEFINTYFATIGEKLATNQNRQWSFDGIAHNGNFELKEVTEEEITR